MFKSFKIKYLMFFVLVFSSCAHFVGAIDISKIDVDVVYNYIDLNDPTLDYEGKNNKEIQKDYENDELKYSLRSVIQNVPWVRKIFIIMPNGKVRCLRETEEIQDRIVYIKDKEFLRFVSRKS